MTLELQEFDMTKIIKKPRANIIVIGKRNSGKTTLVKDIVNALSRSVPLFIAMSRTEPTNGTYKEMMPDICVYDDVDLNKFTEIRERQQKLIQLVEKDKRKYKDMNTNIGLILDDCVDDADWTKIHLLDFLQQMDVGCI